MTRGGQAAVVHAARCAAMVAASRVSPGDGPTIIPTGSDTEASVATSSARASHAVTSAVPDGATRCSSSHESVHPPERLGGDLDENADPFL